MTENMNQSKCFMESATNFFTYNSSYTMMLDIVSEMGSGEMMEKELKMNIDDNATSIGLSLLVMFMSAAFGLVGKQIWSIGLIFYGFLGGIAITGTLVPHKYFANSCVESTTFILLVAITAGLLLNWVLMRFHWLNGVFLGALFSYSVLEFFPSSLLDLQIGGNFLNRSIFPFWAIVLGCGMISIGLLRNNKNAKTFSSAAVGAWGISASVFSILSVAGVPGYDWFASVAFYLFLILFYVLQIFIINLRESAFRVNDTTIILPS